MRSLFNSLGSNYSRSFLAQSLKLLLFGVNNDSKAVEAKLKKQIHSHYLGQISFHYKGRQALAYALSSLGIKAGDEVILQAFTCWAVEEAIHHTQAKPVFADIETNSLNLSLKTIKAVVTAKTKAVILQHTLGYRAQAQEIVSWCRKQHIYVIEDLAHTYGIFPNTKERVADAIVLSFGRDKIIDGISGGACILRKIYTQIPAPKQPLPWKFQARDLVYPLLTTCIKSMYSWHVGKILHTLAKKFGLLHSPISTSSYTYQLPITHLLLAQIAFNELETTIEHRRHIATVYAQIIKPMTLFSELGSMTSNLHLRFPVWVTHRSKLIESLKVASVYVSDTWYRQPVETGSLSVKSSYLMGSCPNAEKLSEHILNLPTHRLVTTQDAYRIAILVNTHLQKYR